MTACRGLQQTHQRLDEHKTGRRRHHHRQQAAQHPPAQLLEVVHQGHLHLSREIVVGREKRGRIPAAAIARTLALNRGWLVPEAEVGSGFGFGRGVGTGRCCGVGLADGGVSQRSRRGGAAAQASGNGSGGIGGGRLRHGVVELGCGDRLWVAGTGGRPDGLRRRFNRRRHCRACREGLDVGATSRRLNRLAGHGKAGIGEHQDGLRRLGACQSIGTDIGIHGHGTASIRRNGHDPDGRADGGNLRGSGSLLISHQPGSRGIAAQARRGHCRFSCRHSG